jgi:hypothetical protein
VIRNAGGVITDDEIRSPAISQRLPGRGRASVDTGKLREVARGA